MGGANGDAFELELLNYNLTSACRPNTHTHTHARKRTRQLTHYSPNESRNTADIRGFISLPVKEASDRKSPFWWNWVIPFTTNCLVDIFILCEQ